MKKIISLVWLIVFMTSIFSLQVSTFAAEDNFVNVNDERNCDIVTYGGVSPDTPEITFHANGGNFGGNESVALKTDEYGFLFDMPQEPTRANYAFEGWYTLAEGGSKIICETYKFLDDCNVYAHWKSAETKIELSNVTLPMPGRNPVFTALPAEGASYYVEWEMWEDSVTGQKMYSDEKMNKALTPEQKISVFASNRYYAYKVKIGGAGSNVFATNAELYINGVKKNYMVSSGVIVADFLSSEPDTFTVYDEKTIIIPEGFAGDMVSFCVADYVGGYGGATFSIGNNAPSWLAVNQSTWTINGTRNTTEVGPYTIPITVTKGEISKEIELRILKTATEPVVKDHPESKTIACGDSVTIGTRAVTGGSVTYKWKVQTEFHSSWFDAASMTASYNLTGYDTPEITVGSDNIFEYLNLKCEITSNGTTITTNVAKVSVKHDISSVKKLIVGTTPSLKKHSAHCDKCGKDIEVAHVKKWHNMLYTDDDSLLGSKYWECIQCGVEDIYDDYESADEKVICYFYANYEGNNNASGTYATLNAYNNFDSKIPYREGYVFAGWSPTPDADVPEYVRGQEVFVGEEGMNFYAIWAQPSVSAEGNMATDENCSDVTGFEGVSYDSKTGTLTLDNAYITAEEIRTLMNMSAVYAKDYLEIKLIGDNSIDSYYENSYGIEVDGTLVISGDGSLDISYEGEDSFLKNGIKAEKVFFLGGHTYIKDCEIALNADAYFYDGILETYIGKFNPAYADYYAFSGEVECCDKITYSASETVAESDFAKQKAPDMLTEDAAYIIVAPFEDEGKVHYNGDRDSAILLYGLSENVRAFVAGYASRDKILTFKAYNNLAPFYEIYVGYNDPYNADVSGIKLYFWKRSNMESIEAPKLIGSIE